MSADDPAHPNTTSPENAPADRSPDTETRQTTVAGQIFGGVAATEGATAIGVAGTVHVHQPQPQPPVPTPRQLHPAPAGFVGREDHLAELDHRTLTTAPNAQVDNGELDTARTVVISAINGTGGIGKTWLALTWAHRHLNRFPDGQLFADLRGFSPTGTPTAPEDVLRGFLDALGIDRDSQPSQLDDQTALYRSKIADKRMLIMLDNAATTDQVVPLLPGTATCTVLITSRHLLPALLTRHGARPLHLDMFTDEESHALLAAALGADRVAAAEAAITELIRLCRGLPLVLGHIATRATAEPHLPLEETVAELRDRGMDALDSEEPAANLNAVLSWSLHRLTDQQRTVFALLGIAPGPDIGLPAATSLIGQPAQEAHALLRELADASLIDRMPGGRYAMHDLVRGYAATHAHTTLPEPTLRTALERVVDFYLHTAHIADRLLAPHGVLIRPEPAAPGVQPHSLSSQPTAMAWLDSEHPHLLAAQHIAAAHHRHHTAWLLATTLTVFHQLRGHLHEDLTMWQTALDAAAHLPDPAAGIRAHRYLGVAHSRLGQREQATQHLYEALALAEHNHDTYQQAVTHQELARAWERRGKNSKALGHARLALGLRSAVNNPAWEADALNLVGWYAARVGEYRTAREHCQAALSLHRHHKNLAGEASALDSLGYIAYHSGRHHQAIDHYQLALTLRRALGGTYNIADTLGSLGHPYAALHQPEHARAMWREALTLYQKQGRTADAEHVQQQLDDLDNTPGASHDVVR